MSDTIYRCEGCGRLTNSPDADLRDLRSAGNISCCPERDMRALSTFDIIRSLSRARSKDAFPCGMHFRIEHDGFEGSVIGHYTRLDGKRGVVGQQAGTNVVHVYGEKWLLPVEADGNKPS